MCYTICMDVNGQAGKGDTYRPVDYKTWSKNFDKIFNKTSKKPKKNKKRQAK